MDEAEKNEVKEDFETDEQPWRPTEEAVEGDGDADADADADAVATADVDVDVDVDAEDVAEVAESPDEQGVTGEISTSSVIEAVLFATDEPISPEKLVAIVGAGNVRDARAHVAELNEKYEQMQCSFRIEAIAGGYQMLTLPDFNVWLRKMVKVRGETKLTPAGLETLAIIAYKQPVLRADVEAIRGVAAGDMVRQLIEKGVVKIVGRAEVLGRPLLYGTTKRFLQVFGLGSLKDLPTAEELKKPD